MDSMRQGKANSLNDSTDMGKSNQFTVGMGHVAGCFVVVICLQVPLMPNHVVVVGGVVVICL